MHCFKKKSYICRKKGIEHTMKTKSLPLRIFDFYKEGFMSMTWGKTLWILIIIKLFIMFAILKVFFFPKFLNRFDSDAEKGNYVSEQLIDRST